MPNEQRSAYVRRRWGGGLEKTMPKGGSTDDAFAKFFSEVTLDVVEENSFRKRQEEEVGPRHVHLRTNAVGEITVPPHLVENPPGEHYCQAWTGHEKVDRNMFILDRVYEGTERQLKNLVSQRDVPVLTARLGKQPIGKRTDVSGYGESFRANVLNAKKKDPIALNHMDNMPMN
eukprot:gnl/MRDRNA2_/MRDRNA2_88343_c0_seq1.p1 gnl/MRDRNA2_/MRDRNA2_88343_c0~~gnl/MRDRNA2_/MRDRNA2_88343_c0_seq1.p1  ORF type:complete len:174 (+),score=36.82 gnl/MRDRNA2_/MRDRNA2_88343_c0_seq1:119-640(+)